PAATMAAEWPSLFRAPTVRLLPSPRERLRFSEPLAGRQGRADRDIRDIRDIIFTSLGTSLSPASLFFFSSNVRSEMSKNDVPDVPVRAENDVNPVKLAVRTGTSVKD